MLKSNDIEDIPENTYLTNIMKSKKKVKSKKREIIKLKTQKKQKNIKNVILKFFMFIIFFSLVLLLIKFLFFSSKDDDYKICICAIGKNENLYIKEFVNYYQKLGYKHIYLYDNNDINGERFEDVIQKEIEKGFVSIINYRGYRGKEQNPQFDAYENCYEKNNKNYTWISFFDIDEYLELVPSNMKAKNFFDQEKFKLCEVIKLNWLLYKTKESLYYENAPLHKRMVIPLIGIKENEHIKSTVRGNLTPNYWSHTINPHTSINNFNTCSSSGIIINSSSPFNSPVEHQYAYIKHYHFRSFEELCLKIKRGRPVPNYKEFRLEKIKSLIEENKNNTEKMDIIKRIFNITFNSFDFKKMSIL